MSPEERTFHLEEFRQLKVEISTLLERVASLFKYGLIGSAAVYAWFLTNLSQRPFEKFPELICYASLIPPALVFYFGILALVTYRQVDGMGVYLQKIERAMGDKALGWETYMRSQKGYLLRALFFFYLLLLFTEIGIAVWVCGRLQAVLS